MTINTILRNFHKLFATLVIILVFVLFVLTIFGIFEVGAMLG
jgi:hypothetical protein